MFTPLDDDLRRGWPGRIEGDRVIQLAAQTLQAFFTGGGKAREHAEYPLDGVRLLAPVPRPPSIRDFYAFEEHVRRARELRGAGPPPPEWYELPVFYFSNPAAVYGPEDTIPFPAGVEELDYELELAAVIGAEGEIGGFTIMNDWSARDLQRAEMAVGLGPSKGKDFATSLGPVLVTVDELDGSGTGDDCARERRGAFARQLARHAPSVVGDRRARSPEHAARARGRAWFRDGGDGVHPRARRRALAAARRRRGAGDRGHRRATEHGRPAVRL